MFVLHKINDRKLNIPVIFISSLCIIKRQKIDASWKETRVIYILNITSKKNTLSASSRQISDASGSYMTSVCNFAHIRLSKTPIFDNIEPEYTVLLW